MDKFKKVIRDMIALFEDHLPLEQKKLKAVQMDDVATVEACMTQEQALVLKLRGLDQKRERVMKELGWDGKTFSQIVASAPEEERQELQKLFEDLDRSMGVFKDVNDNAMTTMEVHLRDIEKVIKIKDPEGRYGQEGNPLQNNRPMTSRKV